MLVCVMFYIVCCYDGDCVGCEVVWCVLENVLFVLKDGVCILFLFLFDGEDFDIMVC